MVKFNINGENITVEDIEKAVSKCKGNVDFKTYNNSIKVILYENKDFHIFSDVIIKSIN